MTPEQLARLERLVMPDAWAFYLTLPPLDTAGLLSDLGSVDLVAAAVLRYACTLKQEADAQAGVAAGELLKAYTDPSGMKVELDNTRLTGASGSAAAWCARADRLEADAARTARRARTPGYVSAPLDVR